MRIPKPSQPPARHKPPPISTKPERLSASEKKKLEKLGKRDGHHALPKQNEDGVWTSPLLQDEVNAYDEFCTFTWGELQKKHEGTYREIHHLCQEIHRTEESLDAQRKAAPPPPDLTARLNGEEKLSEPIVRTRRQREYEKQNAGYFSKLRQTEAALNQACRRLSELCSTTESAEKTTAMLCEQAVASTMKRVTVYWQGALKVHPMFDEIPPNPEVTLKSNAESDYFSQNRAIKDEAARILAHRHYIPSNAQNTNTRTEGYHVQKKRPSRR